MQQDKTIALQESNNKRRQSYFYDPPPNCMNTFDCKRREFLPFPLHSTSDATTPFFQVKLAGGGALLNIPLWMDIGETRT